MRTQVQKTSQIVVKCGERCTTQHEVNGMDSSLYTKSLLKDVILRLQVCACWWCLL